MQLHQIRYFLALYEEAQFHPSSPPLRSLATLADQRHRRAGAGPRRNTVSPQAFHLTFAGASDSAR